MSIPAQGAVGAEMMTAGIGPRTITTSRKTCAGCPALQTKEWTFYGENDDIDSGTDGKCTAAGKVISGYWSERDPTPDWCPALASPRADSDERTADDARHLRTMLRTALNRIVELEASATPAQPAGAVPDSLRALSEAATEGDLNVSNIADGWRHTICAGPTWRVIAQFEREEDAEFFAAAGSHVRTLLASHPAGQNTGQGADDWRERAATEIDAVAQQWGTEGDADGRAYAKTLAAILRSEQSAPDSTRTGQGEATDGWVLVPLECTVEMIRAARARAREMLGGALNALAFEDCWDAALADRPAAPEAQGADFKAAFKKLDDDSLDAIMEVCGEGPEFRRYNEGKSMMRRWFLGRLQRLWNLPAPLASSGQGGR